MTRLQRVLVQPSNYRLFNELGGKMLSEFGVILCEIHGGSIIRTEDESIVFVSSAFNPLTALELSQVVDRMNRESQR
jgi:hypothetical protein